jgi:hypothetical protein
VSEREHLLQVQKQTGRAPKELIGPDFPHIAKYIWDTFADISKGRTHGMSGPNPLSWEGIKAWCDLNQIVLSSHEVDMVKAIDMLWIRISNERDN